MKLLCNNSTTTSSLFLAVGILLLIFKVVHAQDNKQDGKRRSQRRASSGIYIPPGWIDLEMTLPTENDISPEDITEMNFEFNYDDETPTTRMKVVDPNITAKGGGKHKLTIKHDYDEEHFVRPTSSSANDIRKERDEGSKCKCPDIDEIIKVIETSDILKGEKGDRGVQGLPGLSIQGPKGDPGEPGLLPYHEIKQGVGGGGGSPEKGERGPAGPPGFCSPNDCSSGSGSPSRPNWANPDEGRAGPPENLYKIVPGALVFPTRLALLKMKQYSFVGTVAFVEDEEAFYGRVKNGWKSFNMDTRVHKGVGGGYTPNYQHPERNSDNTKPLSLQKSPEQTRGRNCFGRSSCKGPLEMKSLLSEIDLAKKSILRRASTDSLEGNRFKNVLLDHTTPSQIRVIALNSPLNGNMGGSNQVNYQCQRQAMKNNLHGVFRALHLAPGGLGIFNEDSFSLLNLKNQSITGSNIYSFNGKEFGSSSKIVFWVGHNPTDQEEVIGKGKHCLGWTSDSSLDEGLTSTFDQVSVLSSCERKHTVMCIEFLHMSQVHVRHRNNNRVRLSFDRYLAILRSYDEPLQ